MMVKLEGGPADGCEIQQPTTLTMSVSGFDVPEGYVAVYRLKRKPVPERYVFDGLAKVLAHLPDPFARPVAGGS